MLKDLYPRTCARFRALPLFGSVIDDFDQWLRDRGFTCGTRRHKLKDVLRIERFLFRHGRKRIFAILRSDLDGCRTWYRRRNPSIAGTAKSLELFLEEQKLLSKYKPGPLNRTESRIRDYIAFLRDVRGLSPASFTHHAATAFGFLQHIEYERCPSRLARLTARDTEEFIKVCGKHLSRGTLQHTVAHLRGFFRFLAVSGAIRPGLDTQIDTPRLFRLERLPRSLPWNTVQALIRSIDRSTPTGLRDYAIFCLIATYGLRACQIVSLTLDDIHWREKWINVAGRKGGHSLQLPLTDSVATALVNYLRRGRLPSPHREIFLRVRAPAGVLKPTAVTEVFQGCARRSGLDIPYQGPHCIRHSYAVHLLRKGMSLKMIGDLLGHRNAESTCVYLRLDIDDLRSVALPIPRNGRAREVRL